MMIKKIISFEQKKGLKVLIEGFLEKDIGDLSKLPTGDLRGLLENLHRILSKNVSPLDQADPEDLQYMDAEKVILGWHQLLNPIWKKFKRALTDYRERVIQERGVLKSIELGAGAPSPITEYSELAGYTLTHEEKFYPISLKGTSFSIDVSFDSGKVNVYRRDLTAVNSFIDIMRDVPIDVFAKCGYCGKVIIVVRKGKNYCPGCASKAYQKQLWKSDPQGAREREKRRYAERRKISS